MQLYIQWVLPSDTRWCKVYQHQQASLRESTWVDASGSGVLPNSRRGATGCSGLLPLFGFFCGGDLTGVLLVDSAAAASGCLVAFPLLLAAGFAFAFAAVAFAAGARFFLESFNSSSVASCSHCHCSWFIILYWVHGRYQKIHENQVPLRPLKSLGTDAHQCQDAGMVSWSAANWSWDMKAWRAPQTQVSTVWFDNGWSKYKMFWYLGFAVSLEPRNCRTGRFHTVLYVGLHLGNLLLIVLGIWNSYIGISVSKASWKVQNQISLVLVDRWDSKQTLNVSLICFFSSCSSSPSCFTFRTALAPFSSSEQLRVLDSNFLILR